MNLKILAALLIYWGMWVMIFSLGAAVLFPSGATFTGASIAHPEFTNNHDCIMADMQWQYGCTGILSCPKLRDQYNCVLQGCTWEAACYSTYAVDEFTGQASGAEGDEITTGGIFGSGLSFGRFLTLTFFGIGMPDDTPAWAALIFGICQSCITFIGVGWFISSIWNG